MSCTLWLVLVQLKVHSTPQIFSSPHCLAARFSALGQLHLPSSASQSRRTDHSSAVSRRLRFHHRLKRKPSAFLMACVNATKVFTRYDTLTMLSRRLFINRTATFPIDSCLTRRST